MKVLVTGGAGFIGSNLVEKLLSDERVTLVRVMDNLSTGYLENLSAFTNNTKFEFFEADIRNRAACKQACDGMNVVSHQAALGSVPRSVADPQTTNDVNITGTLNIFTAAKEAGIKRVVYAASSSTYGDHPGLPKVEDKIGNPLSPYAVTKYVNELYAKVYATIYGLEPIGLRYFNIFGPKQNPNGPYAAVIPLFIKALMEGVAPKIYGDGLTSRDFTYVSNAVDANMRALFTKNLNATNNVFNIACGRQTSLNELFRLLALAAESNLKPNYDAERPGDVKHSLANISKAEALLGYRPLVMAKEGLLLTYQWYSVNKKILFNN